MSENSMAIRTSDILKELGMPMHLSGYRYLLEIIPIVAVNKCMFPTKVTAIYGDIGRQFGSTSSRVERAIRHAIEVVFIQGDIEAISKYFGGSIDSEKGRPTNKAFIATIADYLYLGRDLLESKGSE